MSCDLTAAVRQDFEAIKRPVTYPKNAELFSEGQAPRGVFILCRGRVKLSMSEPRGKTLIIRLARPGEALGISATLLGRSYQVTAKTLQRSQFNFIQREDFLKFLKNNVDACFKVAEQLSAQYRKAIHGARSLGFSFLPSRKLASVLLEWSSRNGQSTRRGQQCHVQLSQDEIGQMIGTSRETVTRTLADFKRLKLIEANRSTVIVWDESRLRQIAATGLFAG
jgi:CRP/FNR family transcriptional regulator